MTKPTKATQIIAVLTRGKSYSLRTKDGVIRFAKGEPKEVSPDVKATLEAQATDWVTVKDDNDRPVGVHRQKFSFSSTAA
jgi:hypothetical protein